MPPLSQSAASDAKKPPDNLLPRIITYYQTHHDSAGKHISILPLLTQPAISVTHVIVAAIHINDDPLALTLNDHGPDHPRFQTLWAELRILQAAGIKVLALLGGAAKGTYQRLDADDAQFEAYYAPLRDLVRARGLDGLDLDVEEDMTLVGIMRLIDRLRSDFGPGFIITMAPVAMALLDSAKNLSGFDYEALEVMRGHEIAWYNTQFYCGWGDFSTTYMYDLMLQKGWPARKVVIGLVTNPANGKGFVPWDKLSLVLDILKHRNQPFAGVMGWEYFNGLPGDAPRPWEWAQKMTSMLRSHALKPPPSAQAAVTNGSATAVLAEETKEQVADPDGDNAHVLQVPAPFEYISETEE
ncbi:hypothetical protein HIM_06680 [Hirsutella minnesotensis 3608]|uniref:chitinase n=1 Tax=Hirsutella minnesotensis 3608 TaxID=1043627 RepID=A0A0F7ZZD1_9HYPO|nr:hypothetical protein HIM_06680 [Hirsutella minnesotensis 3608]